MGEASSFHPPIRSGVSTQLEGYETKGKVLGKGVTSFVFEGTCLRTGDPVAIKEIDFDRTGYSDKMRQQFESEIVIMQQLSEYGHENILTLRKAFSATSPEGVRYQYLILDYCNREDFKQFLKKKRNILTEPEAKYFMTQFASGLKYMRFHNINHRDLKPQNLLVQQVGDKSVLKIADFGCSRAFDTNELSETFYGSPLYMAPEIHSRKPYNIKADLWSVGVILYEITCGEVPFTGRNADDLIWKLQRQPVKFRKHVDLSPECKDLIWKLLCKNPHQRISWDDFFAHPWFGEPIELPAELREETNPEFIAALDNCLVVAQLADQLSEDYGNNGEILTLYMKFLSEMRELFNSCNLDLSFSAKRIFKQHYSMYLAKAMKMAETTKPDGIASKLIYAASIRETLQGNEAEVQGQFREAMVHYLQAGIFLHKLFEDATSPNDRWKIRNVTELLQLRIAIVSSMVEMES